MLVTRLIASAVSPTVHVCACSLVQHAQGWLQSLHAAARCSIMQCMSEVPRSFRIQGMHTQSPLCGAPQQTTSMAATSQQVLVPLYPTLHLHNPSRSAPVIPETDLSCMHTSGFSMSMYGWCTTPGGVTIPCRAVPHAVHVHASPGLTVSSSSSKPGATSGCLT